MNTTQGGTENEQKQIIVALEGELDASTCMAADQQFEETLAENPASVLVDCGNLQYISSAGLGVLIAFHHACHEKGIPVVFCSMNSKVKNILGILGLDKLFTLEDSLEAAQLFLQTAKK